MHGRGGVHEAAATWHDGGGNALRELRVVRRPLFCRRMSGCVTRGGLPRASLVGARRAGGSTSRERGTLSREEAACMRRRGGRVLPRMFNTAVSGACLEVSASPLSSSGRAIPFNVHSYFSAPSIRQRPPLCLGFHVGRPVVFGCLAVVVAFSRGLAIAIRLQVFSAAELSRVVSLRESGGDGDDCGCSSVETRRTSRTRDPPAVLSLRVIWRRDEGDSISVFRLLGALPVGRGAVGSGRRQRSGTTTNLDRAEAHPRYKQRATGEPLASATSCRVRGWTPSRKVAVEDRGVGAGARPPAPIIMEKEEERAHEWRDPCLARV